MCATRDWRDWLAARRVVAWHAWMLLTSFQPFESPYLRDNFSWTGGRYPDDPGTQDAEMENAMPERVKGTPLVRHITLGKS